MIIKRADIFSFYALFCFEENRKVGPMNIAGKVINNCYYVKEKAGENIYTVNWTAQSLFTNHKVVLKFLKRPNSDITREFLSGLKNTVMKCYSLYHSDIERVFEIDVYRNYTYIAAERIQE